MWKVMVMLMVLSALGCANIQMVSWQGKEFKLCNSPGNLFGSREAFDKAAAKHCKGEYAQLGGGYESTGGLTASKSRLTDSVDVTAEKQLCIQYECR